MCQKKNSETHIVVHEAIIAIGSTLNFQMKIFDKGFSFLAFRSLQTPSDDPHLIQWTISIHELVISTQDAKSSSPSARMSYAQVFFSSSILSAMAICFLPISFSLDRGCPRPAASKVALLVNPPLAFHITKKDYK
ncbi:hypothetical protein O6H91_01G139200 [Diphasiastrum complanatum]|uniref:Uncharacterized protein n=1 Tax=Diphasiastrum complanatum TaxID=34168 RepID=A0ACC2EWM9_DIPCM|nr:hypothetical protein O6H91_01G139200 [Diphasiastrum complanatum]